MLYLNKMRPFFLYDFVYSRPKNRWELKWYAVCVCVSESVLSEIHKCYVRNYMCLLDIRLRMDIQHSDDNM